MYFAQSLIKLKNTKFNSFIKLIYIQTRHLTELKNIEILFCL